MKGVLGYGRYDDDPQHVGCPRARTDMTPCVARDGSTALGGPPPPPTLSCVGCDSDPRTLLLELSAVYEPARSHRQTKTRPHCADLLQRFVREATEPTPTSAEGGGEADTKRIF